MTTNEQTVIQADKDLLHALAINRECNGSRYEREQLVARHRLEAEEQAWRNARELARGTNADLHKGGAGAAYRMICTAISDAVNNPKLRTLAGRVQDLAERKKKL